ncbi:MAG: homoserine O-acetyltransferase [Rubrobacter sp.]|jgi:homoserine O-acetyltransferase|nr:homoserine O-acetyltransferase [Rubrobacter sp.]
MTLNQRIGASRRLPLRSGLHHLPIGSFEPELGGRLDEVSLAYETWGALDASGTNAVLVTHALTGDSHAAGGADENHKRGGWWEPVIGAGRPIDTDEYFVICSNVLGGCAGSTGPESTDPYTGRPYGMRFPTITIRDIVRAQKRLLDELGVRKLALVAGGSIGGQQALEWPVEFPDFVEKSLVVAATDALGPQGLGMSEIGRRAITADPDWQGGDYYGTGKTPDSGLSIARMAGMMTYQSAECQSERFGRNPATKGRSRTENPGGTFDVECYLQYQGNDLVGRFDANSYLYLLRAMDLYDAAHGYSSLEEAFGRIEAETRFVGISSDWLFPAKDVEATARAAASAGANASYVEMESINGHDAFLKDWDEFNAVVSSFTAYTERG